MQLFDRSTVTDKLKAQKPLTIPESLGILVEGFTSSRARRASEPSHLKLDKTAFVRIAGQALDLQNDNSRSEVRRILNRIKTGGLFLILGHGHFIPCGAVSAKQKLMDPATRDGILREPESVRILLDHVSERE